MSGDHQRAFRRRSGLAIGALALMAVSVGCGSDKKGSSTTATTVSAAVTTTVAAPSTSGQATGVATATTAAGTGAATATTAAASGGDSAGVTKDSVKLGIVIEDYPADNTVPFFFRQDGEKAAAAIIAKINAAGGVAGGRKIDPVFVHIVPGFDPKIARDACLKLTKDNTVLAIIAGYAATAANDCFMKDGKTPLIDSAALTDKANAQYGGYHMTPSPTYSRVAKDWVYGAKDLGAFDPAKGFKKLGIVSTSCEADTWDDPDTGVKHWLSTAGVTSDKISEFRSDCTLESLLANHAQALLKHTQDGATTVMIGAQPLDRNYTALAEKQGFAPTYVWGDFHWATQAANAQSLNQKAVDGSCGITAFRQDTNAPAAKACSDAIVAAGLPGFTKIQGDLLVMNICTQLNIFQAVANKAGSNLTRESFVAAAPTVGKIDSAVELSVVFDGDTSGGEMYQVVKWNAASTSWVPQGDPKPSTYTPAG